VNYDDLGHNTPQKKTKALKANFKQPFWTHRGKQPSRDHLLLKVKKGGKSGRIIKNCSKLEGKEKPERQIPIIEITSVPQPSPANAEIKKMNKTLNSMRKYSCHSNVSLFINIY
jgi:hypothetical protein